MASAYPVTPAAAAGPRTAPLGATPAAPAMGWRSRLAAWWQARPIPDDDGFEARQY